VLIELITIIVYSFIEKFDDQNLNGRLNYKKAARRMWIIVNIHSASKKMENNWGEEERKIIGY